MTNGSTQVRENPELKAISYLKAESVSAPRWRIMRNCVMLPTLVRQTF